MKFYSYFLIKPKLCVLDEIDSGLDIDSLKIISKGISEYSNKKLNVNYYTLSKIVRSRYS